MALQTVNQFDIGTKFSNLGSGFQQGQQIASQFQQGQQRRDAAQRATDVSTQQNTKFDQEQSQIRAQVLNQAAVALKSVPFEQRASVFQSMTNDLRAFNIDPSVFEGADFSDLELDNAIAQTQSVTGAPAPAQPSQFEQAKTAQTIAQTAQIGKDKPVVTSELDKAKIAKLQAETSQLGGGKPKTIEALDVLVSEASPELQEQAKAAYELAGGGDKGVKALQKVLEGGVELERRAAAPETLKANFPQADEAELQELQAVVDSSKTTESGFKEAGKLRTKQRQVKKGKVFQKRAVDLLDRILGADELNDVIGSIEGSDESLIPFGGQKIRGDAESEIIADIEEAGNILTADNLDIMSGVLSETDIKIIANLAGGALNRKRGEAAFIKDVTELRTKLQAALGVVGGDKLPKGTTDNNDGTFTLPSGQVVRRKRG